MRTITEELPVDPKRCGEFIVRFRWEADGLWLTSTARLDRNGIRGAGPEFRYDSKATPDMITALRSLYSSMVVAVV